MDTTKITINGKEYEVKKFKFGQQMEYAKVVGKLFEGIKYQISNNAFTDFDLGSLISASPEISLEILAVALNESLDAVKEFDSDEAEAALEAVLKLNPISDVLKKSLSLLGNSLKA